MGEEIVQGNFRKEDFLRFGERLRQETRLLEDWFRQSSADEEAESAGFELELCLVDEHHLPAPENEAVLQAVHDSHLVAELSRFNLEMNSDPHPVAPTLLRDMREELERLWATAESEAERRRLHLLMIGILPTLPEEELTVKNMSPLLRYRELNEQILRQRQGRPLHLNIQGQEHLVAEHSDVMLEAAATSLQIHLQVSPAKAARFFNAALIASAPLVALTANSPYLFGKDLWAETRIPLFEQAVGLQGGLPKEGGLGRVSFGSGYARDSLYGFFLENLERFPALLPVELEEPPECLPHLRLHNGTIWRWNRPIVAPDESGQLHLRIEHRVMPAGPSVPDVVANIAVYLGLVHSLARGPEAAESRLSFESARRNFYAAAEFGLDAELEWLQGTKVSARELWMKSLLGQARRGLEGLGLDSEDCAYYFEEVLFGRLLRHCNGALWQRGFVSRHGRDFPALVEAYADWQHRGLPIHEWKL